MIGKNIIAIGLSGFISCVMAGQALAANAEDMGIYTVTNITNNTDIHDKYPNINSESAVVWQGQDPVAGQDDYEIFMYTPGNGEITQLTYNDFDDEYPEINSNGVVVWQAKGTTDASGTAVTDNDFEIWQFSLADGRILQITDNEEDDESPHVADNGNISWNIGHGADREIMYYDADSGETSQITHNDFDDYVGFYNFKMNSAGQMLWMGNSDEVDALGNSIVGADWEIWSYDPAGVVRRLTHNDVDNWDPQINDSGAMAWEENDGNDDELVYQANAAAIPERLTDNDFNDWYPKLKNNGDLAWMAYDGHDWEIAYYTVANDTVAMLTDNDYDDMSHSINNRGDVAWVAFNMVDPNKPLSLQLYDTTIAYDRGRTAGSSYEITSYMGHFFTPKLNDDGYIAWTASERKGWEIYYAAPNPIPATVSFRPGRVNLKSERKWIKAIIELPEMFYGEDIDAETVAVQKINGMPVREPVEVEGRSRLGDHNGNGVVDLKVRFEADDLMEQLKPGTAEIVVGGRLTDGTPFSGSTLLGVKSKKDRRHNEKHHEKDDKHDD